MSKKKTVVALGHDALGSTIVEQQGAVKKTAKALADLVEAGYQLTITHSNGPQVSMIHKAMTELRRIYIDYTPAPMCVCSAMSQGYVGYDIQNSLKSELLKRGISKPVSTILTQVTVDPYDEGFYEPKKAIGRYMSKDDADIEINKGNYVIKEADGYRRIVAAPKPIDIVEVAAIKTLADAEQVVIACGGGLPLQAEAIAALKENGLVFWLDRDPGESYYGLDVSGRPLAQGGREDFLARYSMRSPIYHRWADFIIVKPETPQCAENRISTIYTEVSEA